VGAYVPLQINSYLTVCCLINGMTKSAVLKMILKKWVDETCPAKFVAELVTLVQQKWADEKQANPKITLLMFQNNVIRELEGKGVEHDIIKTVINSLS
jgi:hypothetical protein